MLFCLFPEYLGIDRRNKNKFAVLSFQFFLFYSVNRTTLVTPRIQIVQILNNTWFGKCYSECVHSMMPMIVSFCPTLMCRIVFPSLSLYSSVKPNLSYFSQLSSFITFTSFQSSRSLLVIDPVVAVTVGTISRNSSCAFLANILRNRSSLY